MASKDKLKDLGKDRSGKRWWHARLYWTDPLTGLARETKRKLTAPSEGLALQRRDELIEELRTGGAVKPGERKRFAEVGAEWLASIKVHATKLSSTSYERQLSEAFGSYWMDALTTRHLQEYLDGLTLTPGSANNVRNAMIRICAHAAAKGYAKVNVAEATKRRTGDANGVARPEGGDGDEDADLEDVEQTDQALNAQQIAHLFDDLEEYSPDLYPLVHTQYMLGCRFSEVSALQRKRVDRESGMVKILRGQYRGVVGRTKGKRARRVGLPPEGLVVLREHLDRMEREQVPGWEDLVFPRPPTGRTRRHNFWHIQRAHDALKASFERTGIVVKGSTHVARHTMITFANDVGPSEALIRQVVGHRSKRVHDGYNHPQDAKILHLGERVGRELLSKRKRALQPHEEGVQGSASETVDAEPLSRG